MKPHKTTFFFNKNILWCFKKYKEINEKKNRHCKISHNYYATEILQFRFRFQFNVSRSIYIIFFIYKVFYTTNEFTMHNQNSYHLGLIKGEGNYKFSPPYRANKYTHETRWTFGNGWYCERSPLHLMKNLVTFIDVVF